MELFFEKLDSINRKQIERVCKGWIHIIRGARKFRTHLKIELHSSYVKLMPGYRKLYYNDWCEQLRHLVKKDLEVLHLEWDKLEHFDSDRSNSMTNRKGISYILWAFRRAGADLSKVEIVLTDCTIDCAVLGGDGTLADTRKISIIRSNIKAFEWYGCATLYFEELWLDSSDKLPEQTVHLFLAEYGPLAEAESDVLRGIQRCLTIDDEEPDMLLIHSYADCLSGIQWGRRYISGFNWFEALTTIVNGGDVSKYTADFLGRSMHLLTDF